MTLNYNENKTTARLVLSDGTVFEGYGFGAETSKVGELCFNTGMTGYQEVMTDPSYASHIITFTFPHIGNVGTNEEDMETRSPFSCGMVLRECVTPHSNWRATRELHEWLSHHGIPGISGIDTRTLTARIRDIGAPNAVICHDPDGRHRLLDLQKEAREWPGLEGMDLASRVCTHKSYLWDEGIWRSGNGYSRTQGGRHHVVAIDYGAKLNILRNLAETGCKVTVVPANASADEILAFKPDGIFLSNGPGDPAATAQYSTPILQKLINTGKPVFGICLGHQLLALALGGKTEKMHLGHRGANHPVKDLMTGKVEITSQNHGFKVIPESLPETAEVTHISLFDHSNEGFRIKDKPVFSVQYHPEASPGPQDSAYLFRRFAEMMKG